MAKKEKKDKKGKKPEIEAEHHEIDAVKGFIVVMLLLIVALAVFIFYTRGKLSDVNLALDRARAAAQDLGDKSIEVEAYLGLIKDTGETVLMLYPNRFFGNIYTKSEIGIAKEQVSLRDLKETPVRRPFRYTESSWDLDISGIDRRQAALVLHGVETESLKAKVIELRLRRKRSRDAPEEEDLWDAAFTVGYRTAGTSRPLGGPLRPLEGAAAPRRGHPNCPRRFASRCGPVGWTRAAVQQHRPPGATATSPARPRSSARM